MHWCIIHALAQGVCYDSIDYKLQRGHQHIDSRSNSRTIVTHIAICEGMYAPHHHLFRSIAWSMYLWARIFTANWWAYIHVSDVVICNCIDVASDVSFHSKHATNDIDNKWHINWHLWTNNHKLSNVNTISIIECRVSSLHVPNDCLADIPCIT